MRRISILFIFFLTGISGLIYQVAWVRQATLVFGVSVYAYSVVLAAFMGGLALGSYWLGRRADHTEALLRFFARLQIGIALFGALSPFLLTGLMPLYASIARGLPTGSPLIVAVRALFSILILTPPTFLMGATLPVLARAVVTRGKRIGSEVGQLYAADTLGAALGCALTGLFLLRTLGTRETILLAATLNLLAAALAFFLMSRLKDPTETASRKTSSRGKKAKAAADDTPIQPISPFVRRFILWAYAISGFVALGYEVVWARVLAIFTLDAVYSFAIMLTTFLAGITLGGWLCAWWLRQQNRRVTLTNFVDLQIGLGIAALITLFVFARLPAQYGRDI
ncbi:MAG: fused MFS/spermidine synthase [Caldilineaceae bacterium]